MAFGVAASVLLLPLHAEAQKTELAAGRPVPVVSVQTPAKMTAEQKRKTKRGAAVRHTPHGKTAIASGMKKMGWGNTTVPSAVLPPGQSCQKATPNPSCEKVSQASGEAIVPPYCERFDTEESLSAFTIIDHNGDGSTWSYDAGTQEDPNGSAKYSYSEQNGGDDWLISPPIRLEKGRVYTVKFKLKTKSAFYSEKVEVCYGTSATVDAMTHVLLPETAVKWEQWEEIVKEVQPSETGDFYLGFHALSDRDQYAFFLDDIEIDAGTSDKVPCMVENLQATAGAKGARSVTVSFDTPSKTAGGDDLMGKVGVKVMRDGVLVKELSGLEPGSTQSFVDEDPAQGFNSYCAVASTADGEGRTSNETKVYVGLDSPVSPQDAVAMDNVSSVNFSWTDSGRGLNGGYVDTETLSHKLYRMEATADGQTPVLVGEAAAGANTFALNMRTDEGEQTLTDFGVSAVNELGESDIAVAPSIIVGAPYELPFFESFSGGELDNGMWWIRNSGDSEFLVSDGASDNDGGCLAYDSYDPDEYSVLGSGKITLAGATHPTLTFCHKASAESNARIVVAIQKPDGTEEELKTVHADTDNGEWVRETIDIDTKYCALPFLYLQFTVSSNTYEYVMLDEIGINDDCERDMAVKEINAPRTIKKGEQVKVGVTVQNRGTTEAQGFTVSLYAGGQLVGSKTEDATLQPMAVNAYSFDYATSIMDEGEAVELKAEVDYDGDMKEANNMKSLTMQFAVSGKPCPQNVTVSANDDGSNTVRWTAPAVAYQVVNEGFEGYESWTQDQFGGWTTRVENRKDATGNVFASYSYPGEGEPFAFILAEPLNGWIDEDVMSKNPVLRPHGGDKYLAAFYSLYEDEFIDADDWLISPVLSGNWQTVTFWVGNLNAPGASFAESFEVFYSTGGTETKDFTKVGESHTAGSGTWEQVSVELPEGATRFAIRRNTLADEAMVFLIDDMTYEAGAEQPTAYRVYRDGTLLATVEAGKLDYTDATAAQGENYTYAVTAVFANEESEAAIAEWTAYDGIQSAGATLGTPSYTVYTLDGKLVGANMKSLNGLKRGIYIINDRKVSIR